MRGCVEKVAPQILFLVCGYGKESLIIAFKDLHIPVVEFQHGVLSKYHLGYDFSLGKKENFADYFSPLDLLEDKWHISQYHKRKLFQLVINT